MARLPPDLQALQDALDVAERDARALVDGLTEAQGTWRADAGSWSVAECLDHLATSNVVYLAAMRQGRSALLLTVVVADGQRNQASSAAGSSATSSRQ